MDNLRTRYGWIWFDPGDKRARHESCRHRSSSVRRHLSHAP
jgi:hypothetical protein